MRALADDVMKRRDGLSGWRRHAREFRALLASTPGAVMAQSERRLRELLMHAGATVPYYRGLWEASGFRPAPSTTLDEFRRLPLLTKMDIRRRRDDLVSRVLRPTAMAIDYTGGTTGTQTSFFRDHACRTARVGRQIAILEQCGYRRGERRAMIWGAHADYPAAGPSRRLRQWVRRYASADEVLCCTVMSRHDMREYYERLRRFRPRVLYGYPNAIEEFVRFMIKETISPIRVQRVFCTAELLRDSQRALFAETLGADVFNLYCSREHGCVAFECDSHDALHLDAGSVFLEILVNGRPAKPGETGQIVITDLFNRAMPFIRYVTGDLGTAAAAPCACGSPLPTFSRLDGRLADLVYRPDGTVVSGLMLDDLFMGEPAITHAQFRQERLSGLDVLLVLDRGAARPPDLESRVIGEVRSIMGPDADIHVRIVPDVERHPQSGKYRLVIGTLA